MTIESFILDNIWVLLAYLILAIIVYVNRKKFIVENKVFLLYKTQRGVDFINKFADKYKEFVKLLGYSAIGIGFAGMIVIVGFFVKGLYDLIFVPSAPATVSLVIPGVSIPGSPITIPFVYGILSLFIVVTIHEFGHGIVARANGIKIKSTGVGLLGPLPLAFVEPDEKQLVKQNSVVQHSIFGAGPFMNVLLTAVVLIILLLVLTPLTNTMSHTEGITFNSIQKGYAAEKYGIEKNIVYTHLNGAVTNNSEQFVAELVKLKPNDRITLTDHQGNIIPMIVGENPKNASQAYLGVVGISDNYVPNSNNWLYQGAYYILYFFAKLFFWVYVLSLGIGLANLLPLGPVDGGRMLNTALIDMKGKEKGMKLWAQISWVTLAVMLILLLVPIFKAVVLKI